jgi:hypothetical protein
MEPNPNIIKLSGNTAPGSDRPENTPNATPNAAPGGDGNTVGAPKTPKESIPNNDTVSELPLLSQVIQLTKISLTSNIFESESGQRIAGALKIVKNTTDNNLDSSKASVAMFTRLSEKPEVRLFLLRPEVVRAINDQFYGTSSYLNLVGSHDDAA